MSAVSKLRSLENKYSLEELYSQIGKSRQSYYKAICSQQKRKHRTQAIIEQVLLWRTKHPRMGSRSLYFTMKEAGIDLPIGVTAFERLLSERGLTVGTAKRSGPYTSDGLGKRNYSNLTNGLILNNINQLIVADITYFWVNSKWCYLFVLKDVYSQRIISLVPSEDMKSKNGITTLNDLQRLRGKEKLKECIHHSDNGSQYEADEYKKYLENLGIKISRAKSCKENGSCEQMNHIVKNMYLMHFGIRTFKDLQIACKKVKLLMNNERSVKQLGNVSVDCFEKSLAHLPDCKRIKKTLHDFNYDIS